METLAKIARKSVVLPVFFASLILSSAFGQSGSPQLWYYLTGFPLDAAGLASLESSVDQAMSYGYNGVMLADGDWSEVGSARLSWVDYSYAAQFVRYIQSKGMKVIVSTAPFGYSDDALTNNPNWAEGEHITGSQFTVNSSKTALVPVNTFGGIVNAGFESGRTGWFSLNQPNMGIDNTVAHTGTASGYVTNVAGTALFYQLINVTPWRQYHGRIFLKTSNFSGNAQISVVDPATNTTSFIYYIQMLSTQDWIQFDFTFNSRGSTQPALSFGVAGGSTGTMWFDDMSIEETSLVYVLRRSGTPIKMYDPANPGKVYVEQTDFNTITDPNIAAGYPFPFGDFYHTPSTVTLPATTSLLPGQTVAIDYYAVQPVALFQGDVGICLTEPAAQAWMQQNLQVLANLLPAGVDYLIGYDEMRHMNSCALCKAKNLTAGQLLASHVSNTVNAFHSIVPSASFSVLSDMFDPYHNAVSSYYYVEGDLFGSWTGVSSNMTVFNWNLWNLKNSLTWFSGLNSQQPIHHNQIISGYYDSGNGAATAIQELQQAAGVPGLLGLMYTTNYNDYSQARQFAAAVLSNWNSYLASVVSTVTPQITVVASAVTLNRTSGLFSQTVKLTNNGGALAAAAYVMDSLPSGVSVVKPDGLTSAASPAGSPYKEAGAIGAGATVTLTIQFTRSGTPPITYTPRILGSGPR